MPAPERSTTGKPPRAVRVWGEVGVTVQVSENPRNFVRASSGHERIAPDDSLATLKRYTKMIDEYNEDVINAQVEKYTRLAKAVSEGRTSRRRRTPS